MLNRKILLFILLLPASQVVLAQAKFSTVVSDKEIGKNDYLQVEYTIENFKSVDQFSSPTFKGFNVVSGPSQQSSTSMINGVTSNSASVIYVLHPLQPGKITVPGATATVDGKQLHSNPVEVEVTNSPVRKSNVTVVPAFAMPMPAEPEPDINEEYVLKPGQSSAEKIKNNLLVKVDASKTTCYVGESIVATYKLCSRLKSESRVTHSPSLTGFSVYDLGRMDYTPPFTEKINGKPFTVHLIRKVQLYPLQDGKFELDPAEVDNVVHFIRLDANTNRNSQQLLDDYLNGMSMGKIEDEHITLSSKPVTITVKPLPEAGKPASFDGAVGKFAIKASVEQDHLATGETGKFFIELQGQGNLTLINAPKINWPSSLEGYEPTVSDDLNKAATPISGKKTFQYTFTTKQEGDIIIPPIEFSYFDPATATYKTLHTDSITLKIVKGNKRRQNVLPSNVTTAAAPDTESNWSMWLTVFAGAIAVVAALFFFLRKKKNKDEIKTSAQPTVEIIEMVDPFAAARHELQEGRSQLFYKEIGNTIWNSLSEKLQITSSQLNKPSVVRLLQQKGASVITIAQLEAVLNDCELALYTPVHSETDMKITLEKAEDFLISLNKV